MWSGNEVALTTLALFLLFGIAYYVERIHRKVRLMELNQKRLSITFLKIENDLSAIQDSLIVVGQSLGDQTAIKIAGIRDRRPELLRFTLENGPGSYELLRGLEPPNPSEDPVFAKEDILRRLGLDRPPT